MRTIHTFILCAILMIVCVGCSANTFFKEPIFPLSQYEPEKKGHGLVLTTVGPWRYFPGDRKSWLERCDYAIDRKKDEPYVIFPEYIYSNCIQYGPVHTH